MDANGKYVYVSERGENFHYLHQFDAETGMLFSSIPLSYPSAPAGIAIMQKTCFDCE